ncbi:MAG: methyltransferase domain-containing protein [Acidimicrobiales bacterium]
MSDNATPRDGTTSDEHVFADDEGATRSVSIEEFNSAGRELWESHAGWWQENFSEGVDPEYTEQILPLIAARVLNAGAVLEIGVGEGQVLRTVGAHSSASSLRVGIDPSFAQCRVAQQRSSGEYIARAEAKCLPFASDTFDLVIACLVFEHIVEVDEAIVEVARVLRPGGRFLFLLNHPLLQTPNSGWIDDQILMEQYWRIGNYLSEDVTVEEVHKGVFIPFVHRPLSRYVNALADVGLYLRHMDEPAPPQGFLAQAWEYQEAAQIPRLLALELEKATRVER